MIRGPLLLHGQTGARNGEWPTYGGDLGNTRYSPLALAFRCQIDAAAFITLSNLRSSFDSFAKCHIDSTKILRSEGRLRICPGGINLVKDGQPGTRASCCGEC